LYLYNKTVAFPLIYKSSSCPTVCGLGQGVLYGVLALGGLGQGKMLENGDEAHLSSALYGRVGIALPIITLDTNFACKGKHYFLTMSVRN
jgi:hypothetical protein